MRALIFDGQGTRLNSAHPSPVAAKGEAIVRLVCAGVSAVDIQVCRGQHSFTGVLGHQFVGIVESVNSAGAGSQSAGASLLGKRVAGSPIISCGKCDMCMSGLSVHCRSRTIMGFLGRDGCMAERFAFPVANLFVVPDSVDNDHAVFASELAQTCQASNRLTIERKPFITVLGANSLALLMVQVMAKLNASVRIVGDDVEQLAKCEKWAIKHRPVDEVGRRADQDIVVECTGRASLYELATQLVRPRGTIVLAGLAGASERVNHDPIYLNELQIIGAVGGGSIAEALNLLMRREVDVVSLISRRMNLSEGPAIMKTAAQPGISKVVVEP
jgi:threonine dehydrogenase-like Zn-dependent dehydrogenase